MTMNFQMKILNFLLRKIIFNETIEFNYQEKDSVEGVYGKVYQCHFETVPLHKSGKLSIRSNVPDKLKDKVYIAKNQEQ